MKFFSSTKVAFVICSMLILGCGSKGSTGPAGPQGPQGNMGPTIPSITAVSPIPGSINAPLDSVIRASFTKAMDASTLNASTVQVSAGGVPIAGTISYNAGSQTVYFTPGLPLTAFTAISAVLTTGVKDAGGTALAGTYSWSFNTGGSYAPSRLYVSNSGGAPSVLVFNNAGAATGNIFPDRNVAGAATTLNGPAGIWLDKASDRLYVADTGASTILVFNNAGTASGNVAPARTISGAATTMTQPTGLWVDGASDTLYEGDLSGGRIVVFANASTAAGNVAPARTIGAGTTFTAPYGLWLDSASNTMYVGDLTGQVLAFTNASTINGNTAPARVLAGAATTLSPELLMYDPASDRLYVANYGFNSVLVFNGASTATGNIAPSRTIAGGNTGINFNRALWFDSGD